MGDIVPLIIGDVEISWLDGGSFHLDGGAMFGPVPKALWSPLCPADEENSFLLRNDPLLVKTPQCLVLVDTGLGNKLTAKQKTVFKVASPWDLPAGLNNLGFAREDVTHVILTHGDFDHAGGIVMLSDDGQPELTCPNAIKKKKKKEWEDIGNPHPRAKSVYLKEDFAELRRSSLLELVDGNEQVCPGVSLRFSGGHTRGHQLVEIRSGEMTAVHLGDLFPTHFHVNPLWVMAYDNYPLEVIDRKLEYFAEYSSQNTWFTLYHDPQIRACRLDAAKKVKETWPFPFCSRSGKLRKKGLTDAGEC